MSYTISTNYNREIIINQFQRNFINVDDKKLEICALRDM